MIIKSFELDKINVKSSNFYLFYGENEGYKNEAIEKIFNINISKNERTSKGNKLFPKSHSNQI